MVGALAAELELAPGARLLDLAAGTGKLTRPLLAGGLDVVAVEPQAPLRDRLSAIIGGERVREGFAEALLGCAIRADELRLEQGLMPKEATLLSRGDEDGASAGPASR